MGAKDLRRGRAARRRNWLESTVSGVVLATAAIIYAGPVAAQQPHQTPAVSEQTIAFDIPAQDLNAALLTFTNRAGLQVFYDVNLVKGLRSSALKGSFTPAQGLTQLLAGSGMTYRFTGANTVSLEKLPQPAAAAPRVIQLGPVRVEGDSRDILTPKTDSAATDQSHSYAARAATVAGKTAESLRDIPQSVSVITRQQMDDMNAVTVEQVLRQATGITSTPLSPEAGFFYIRGYPAEVQYDGVPSNGGISNVDQFDSAIYDRIEVLRGPAGLLQGAGSNPGGTINLVRKRPHETFGWAGSLMGGSWNNFHGDLDVTGPLNQTGTIRGRVVVSGDDRDFFVDDMHDRRATEYAILEFDLSEKTTLTISGTNEDRRLTGLNFGQSVYNNGQFLNAPRSTYFGVKGTQYYVHEQEAYTSLDHDFGGGWAGRASFAYRNADTHGQSNSLYGPVNLDNSGATLDLAAGPADLQTFTYDTNVLGPINLFGRTHTLLFGANYAYYDYSYFGGDTFYSLANIYNITSPLQSVPLSYGSDSRTVQYGVYGQARISIADPLTVVAGVRLTNYRSKSRSGYPNYGEWDHDPDVNGHFNPTIGIIYDLTHEISLYGSYATIFAPQSGQLVFGGGSVKPRTGDQYEIGAKGTFFNGALNASAALFNLTDRNRAVADPEHGGTIDYYVAAGKVRSRGAEVEVSGEPLPGWNVFAGYTYLETKYLEDPNNLGKTFDREEPRHSFKAWTSYRFGDVDQPGFQVGGGVRVMSETTRGGPWQSAYAVADAQIGYRLNRQWSATLTANNIFDKKYYIRVPSSFFGNYGDPRSFTVTLRKSF